MTCDVILAPNPGIKGRNKEIKLKEKKQKEIENGKPSSALSVLIHQIALKYLKDTEGQC